MPTLKIINNLGVLCFKTNEADEKLQAFVGGTGVTLMKSALPMDGSENRLLLMFRFHPHPRPAY